MVHYDFKGDNNQKSFSLPKPLPPFSLLPIYQIPKSINPLITKSINPLITKSLNPPIPKFFINIILQSLNPHIPKSLNILTLQSPSLLVLWSSGKSFGTEGSQGMKMFFLGCPVFSLCFQCFRVFLVFPSVSLVFSSIFLVFSSFFSFCFPVFSLCFSVFSLCFPLFSLHFPECLIVVSLAGFSLEGDTSGYRLNIQHTTHYTGCTLYIIHTTHNIYCK